MPANQNHAAMMHTLAYLVIAVLLNGSYPGQHVVATLGLEQVLAVGRGEPEDVFALGVAVGDVDQAGFDAHLLRLVVELRVQVSLLPVLIEEDGVASQHCVHLLPHPHSSTHTLHRA